MADGSVRKLTAAQLNTAMRLNVLTGCLATVWQIVCSIQPIFNVFVRNELGASASTLGALVGLIQLSALFQLASIFIYGYAPRKKPFFIAAHLLHRLLTLAIAAGAFIAAANGDRSWGVRAIMIALPISWAFMNASSAGWWSWVADLFPEKIRGTFFLKRSSMINVVNVVWFFLASMFLDLFEGPARFWTYGVIFAIGALSGLADIILNIFIPEPESTERALFSPRDALEPLKNQNFVRFSVAVGIATFSINLIAPFQAPFVVDPNRVGAPNTWLGIMFVISQLTWVLVAPFWGAVMDKWGRKPVVVLGCMFTLSWTGYFFLTPRSFTYLLPLISIGVGLLSPAFWEGINQMMLSLSPNKNRIAFVAWYMTIVGVVSAGGSVVGGFLLDALSPIQIQVGPFRFVDFHFVQFLSIAMVILSAWIISRVREGRERAIGFVVGGVANFGIIRTYAYLDDLATSVDPGRAEQALRSIEAETGDLALDEILARLDDPYSEIREEAARALGRIGSPLAAEALIDRLQDPSSTLRIAAARALGKIRDLRAVEPLASALKSAKSEELQEACVQALGDIGGDRAAEEILDFHRHTPSDRLRASSSDAASRLGVFEAARDTFPRLVEGRTSALRRQYAIALGNLLGVPGDFYRYVSGSGSGKSERIGKLFGRLQANMRSAVRRSHGKGKNHYRKKEAGNDTLLIRTILENLEGGREGEALRSIVAYAEGFLSEIFGRQVEDADLIELAFRAEQKLGAFAWFLSEIRTRIDSDLIFAHSKDPADVQRLLVLLVAYFLASS